MEKVTAFKATDGKLFESEEKCCKWEKKLSQFPKQRVTTKEVEPGVMWVNDEYKPAPHTKWLVTQYYRVMDKYDIMYFDTAKVLPVYEGSGEVRLDLLAIEMIKSTGKFDEESCQTVVGKFKETYPKHDIRYREVDGGWVLYDRRIYSGLLSPMEGYVNVKLKE